MSVTASSSFFVLFQSLEEIFIMVQRKDKISLENKKDNKKKMKKSRKAAPAACTFIRKHDKVFISRRHLSDLEAIVSYSRKT